jgi:hypothetical protein
MPPFNYNQDPYTARSSHVNDGDGTPLHGRERPSEPAPGGVLVGW